MALGVDGVRVGVWTREDGPTGCTVVLPPAGTVGGMAVRGAAPGTREAAALGPAGKVAECHGAVLSGGSAFGLATADGVVRWLAEHGVGYEVTPAVRVPIVGAAIVFDLRPDGAGGGAETEPVWPDAEAGRAACAAATSAEPPVGRVGVGAGCTVGKIAGVEYGVPAGQGVAVERDAGVTVGALVAANALGEVVDEGGEVLAGSTAPPEHPRFPYVGPPHRAATEAAPGQRLADRPTDAPPTNTVIGCVVTDAPLDKAQACRVADLAHSGVARAVDPAHTSFDGDALFCLATGAGGTVHADLIAHLGARAVAAAIRAAVRAGRRR